MLMICHDAVVLMSRLLCLWPVNYATYSSVQDCWQIFRHKALLMVIS